MIRVGITGQNGFIGSHLYNSLGLFPDEYTLICFNHLAFNDNQGLEDFVQKCDVVVHLAALNRHNDPEVIYKTNIELVNKLIAACEATNSKPHIIFSSSTQEEKDNAYGRSKKVGRYLLKTWAEQNGAKFTGLIIPNVFGPFGHPFYNSVVATFCHQLTHNDQPKIEIDGELNLIYVGELVEELIRIIKSGVSQMAAITEEKKLLHTATIKVSDLLLILENFKSSYFDKGEMPNLNAPFLRNLFITFLCYIDHSTFFPFKLKLNADERGTFVETIRLNSGGQVSFSVTVPNTTRGNHFHTRKVERFAVIKGQAKIEIRQIGTNKTLTFLLNGNQPAFVDMPVWHTHNITNIGNEELLTIFWINEFYNVNDADTFFEKV